MKDLRDYLAKTRVRNVSTLAYISGIDEKTLADVADKRLSLGSVHKSIIREILPSIPESVLSPKHEMLPNDFVTGRGKIPEGYTFIQIEAGNVKIGDLILVSHQSGVAGSRWVAVSSLKEQGKNAAIFVGDIDIRVNKTILVKVARKSNEFGY